VLFAKPDYEIPELPDDITVYSDEQLMVLFTQYIEWQNYAASELAQAETAETKAEAKVRYAENMSLLASNSDKVTVARAELSLDPVVEEARQDFLRAYAHRKMTAMISANCERCAALVSRELSRRIGREPMERRQMRWNP
jgi:hypothetical protein